MQSKENLSQQQTPIQKLVSLIEQARTTGSQEAEQALSNHINSLSKEQLKEKVQLPNGKSVSVLEYVTSTPENTENLTQHNKVAKLAVEAILAKADKTTFTKKELDNSLDNAKKARAQEKQMNRSNVMKGVSLGSSVGASAVAAVGGIGGSAIPVVGNVVGGVVGAGIGHIVGGMVGGAVAASQMDKTAKHTKDMIKNFSTHNAQPTTQTPKPQQHVSTDLART